MGTRGLYGFRKNGIDKITYNHYDSYPEGLGKEFVRFCKHNSLKKLNKFYDLITLVDSDTQPKEFDIQYCREQGWMDLTVGEKRLDDWYCLTRNLQGNFEEYQKCIDYKIILFMNDGSDLLSSIDYAYIMDLDTGFLEFRVGFQKEPDESNRYGIVADDFGYYPAKLMGAYELEYIKENKTKDIINKMNWLVGSEFENDGEDRGNPL